MCRVAEICFNNLKGSRVGILLFVRTVDRLYHSTFIESDKYRSNVTMSGKPILVISALSAFALMLLAWTAMPGTAVVNWTDTYQVIDGFGGS